MIKSVALIKCELILHFLESQYHLLLIRIHWEVQRVN